MRIIKPTFLASMIFSGLSFGQTTLVEESFTYADGLVDTLDGGTGWSGAWEAGNSVATQNRFEIGSNEALYLGGGVGTYTEQNRSFATAVTSSTTDIIRLDLTLLRRETQSGRGIGIYLTNGGANQFFIGKEVNGTVGLHAGMGIGSDTFATFSSNSNVEPITVTITSNGTDTSIVLSDSDETLPAHIVPGTFTFDGISLAGYNGATTTNGIDELSVVSTPAPDPWLQVADLVELTGNGGATVYSIPIFNGGATQTLNISDVSPTGFDAADISGLTFPDTLAPLTAGAIEFTFTPSAGGALYFFDLEIASDDASDASPRIVQVEVDVADPIIEVDSTTLDFGALANNPGPQTASVNVTNAGGSQALTINSTDIAGSAAFSVTSAPVSIAPGATEAIEITFAPGTQPGAFSATLTILSNDFNLTEPTVELTASTALGGTILADYNFGAGAPIDLTSADLAPASVAADLVETDLGGRTEFGLRITNATQANITNVDGNALGWSRREAPNGNLDLTLDAPTEAIAFTITPGGGASLEMATNGWLLLDLASYSGLGGPTGYDFVLTVDDGTSPFTIGPVAGPSIPGAGSDELQLTFDVRSLGTVTGPVTFTLMPQTTGNTNGVSTQAGGYLDNVILTGEEALPETPALFVESPSRFDDEGLGGFFSIPISNTGAVPLTISAVTTDGSGNASAISNITFDPTLAGAGGTGFIDFDFTPDAGPGLYTTNLTITSNDPNSPTTVILEITVLDPEILVTTGALDFGTVTSGSAPKMRAVTVFNDGEAADLEITGANFSGPGAASYSAVTPTPIAPGESGEIIVTLDPGAAEGQLSATLEILSNAPGTAPQVALEAVVEPSLPSGTVVARYNFDLGQVAGTTVDGDSSLGTPWSTGVLLDAATGTGALGASNQAGANRGLAAGPTGNYLLFSCNREGDGQTPVAPGGNDESTWTRFTVSPPAGGGAIDYTGGSVVVDTLATTSLGAASADWTLYYSTDGGTTWISLGTQPGATSSGGLGDPVALTWDPTPIGDQGGPVDFLLDPVSTSATNGNLTQRGVGFDNLVVTAGGFTPGSSGFGTWAADNGIVNDPNGDTDGDGIEELVEYALGLDPNAPDGFPGTLDGATLSFTKGAEAVANGDVTYGIETSSDLGQTDPWTPVDEGDLDSNDASSISYTLPGGSGKIFARLVIDEL